MGSVFRMKLGGPFPSSLLPSGTFALCWLFSGAGILPGKFLIGKGLPLFRLLTLSSVVHRSPFFPVRGGFWGKSCVAGTLPVILGPSLLVLPVTVNVQWHYRGIFQHAVWPFPDGLVEWQASLDSLELPAVSRRSGAGKTCFFTDGSCLFPAISDIRMAAGAVVTPEDAGYTVVWSGLLPTSNQTIQRAEILSGAIATGAALHPVVISDSLYFVRFARRLHELWCRGLPPWFPDDNRDLWEFFWASLEGCESAEFVWTKAHRSLSGLTGLELAIAQGNDAADQQAKARVKQYQASSVLYRRVVQSKLGQLRTRSMLDAFHVHLALAAVGQATGDFCAPCEVDEINLVGPAWKAPELDPPSAGFHVQFVGQVFNWFRNLHWFSGCSAGGPCDISWVELFLFWVVDSGCVPPFLVDGKWVRVGVDEDAVCCVPSAYTLFRTWRRAVSFVLRTGCLVPGNAVDSCGSAVGLGARLPLSGLTWRPRVPLAVRRDLSVQFSSLRSLPSLRLPPVW